MGLRSAVMAREPTPVARGFLSGTGLGYHSMNGTCQPPTTIEHIGRFPYGSSNHNAKFQPRVSLQSRAFHGSRAASIPVKGVVANRPLSPHLPVKKPQLSATFSISHRIFGASLGTFIMLTPLLVKFSTTCDV